MFCRRKLFLEFFRHRCTSGRRPIVALNEAVRDSLEQGQYKPRKHPGINKTKTGSLPPEILNALEKTTRDYPIKTIMAEGEKLYRYLKSRHPPIEQDVLQTKAQQIRDGFIEKKRIDLNAMEEEARGIKERAIQNKVQNTLKHNVYNWYSLKYDQFKALQYLLVRSPAEYAVLYKIFAEIKARDPSFSPRGFFDFGSGVGTAVWALGSVWDRRSVFEYYLCDASKDMNDLSEMVLRGGDDNKQLDYRNLNYRQFLPARSGQLYNLVVSAYSLFELDSQEARLKTVQALWDKCEDYLVLVENGSKAAFGLINEAREFILEYDRENSSVFSPCAHNLPCPRIKINDGTPCNFVVNYQTTGLASSITTKKELYSYVVIKKGRRTESSPDQNWPRLVRPVLVRKKHSVCRLCTANGKLEEVVFSASKHGKNTYHCARSSEWGDRLPIEWTVGKEEEPSDSQDENKVTVEKSEE